MKETSQREVCILKYSTSGTLKLKDPTTFSVGDVSGLILDRTVPCVELNVPTLSLQDSAGRYEDGLYVFKTLSASAISLVDFGWTIRPYLLPYAERELERQS